VMTILIIMMVLIWKEWRVTNSYEL
jgi:hypothetical protein